MVVGRQSAPHATGGLPDERGVCVAGVVRTGGFMGAGLGAPAPSGCGLARAGLFGGDASRFAYVSYGLCWGG